MKPNEKRVKRKHKKRPPRIFIDNKGRYINLRGKKIYLQSGLTNNQLVRVIVNNFQKQNQKKKKKRKGLKEGTASAKSNRETSLDKIATYLTLNRGDIERRKIADIEKELVKQDLKLKLVKLI